MTGAEPPLRVVCLAGPTGAGKTALALALAREFGCEIVNADSRQLYRDFPVITAQPEPADRACAPHHLYGFLELAEKSSAGAWVQLALEKCRQITARGRLPLLVGGTGFYFEALLAGLAAIPQVDSSIVRDLALRLKREGPGSLYRLLQAKDPIWAKKIHPNDSQRILRGLEIWLGTGRPLSWWHSQAAQTPAAAGPLLVCAASLAWLEPRLKRRIGEMLERGALEEAARAARKNPDPQSPGWSGIGCGELLAYLQGRVDLQECRQLWLANTRAYAKRQLTWFRARKNAIWIKPEDAAGTVALLAGKLAG